MLLPNLTDYPASNLRRDVLFDIKDNSMFGLRCLNHRLNGLKDFTDYEKGFQIQGYY